MPIGTEIRFDGAAGGRRTTVEGPSVGGHWKLKGRAHDQWLRLFREMVRCRTVAWILPNRMVELVLMGNQVGSRCRVVQRQPGTVNKPLLCTGNAPTVMGILRRAALNMVRTIQRKLETCPSDCCVTASDANPESWPPPCPETDFAFALRSSRARNWPAIWQSWEGWRPKPGSTPLLLHQGRHRMGPARAVGRGAAGRPSPMLTHACSRQGASGSCPTIRLLPPAQDHALARWRFSEGSVRWRRPWIYKGLMLL